MEKTGEKIEKGAGTVLAVDDEDEDVTVGIQNLISSSEQQMELFTYSTNGNLIRDRLRELVKKITLYQKDGG